MCIATYTDVKNNPRYGPCKLNPGLPFSVVIKNLIVDIFGAPIVPLYIAVCHEYIYAESKVYLATIQNLMEVIGSSLANG